MFDRRALLVVALTVGLTACVKDRVERTAPTSAVLPPARDAKPQVQVETADNSYCYVCHRNYEKEEVTAAHAKAGIGCEKCHGVSERHSSDEDGITPPEIMYARRKVHPFCIQCHPSDELKRVDDHKQMLLAVAAGKNSAAAGQTELCTDCHGEHRLKVRTRVWDKDTGKLVADDGVRMMDKNKPPAGGQQ